MEGSCSRSFQLSHGPQLVLVGVAWVAGRVAVGGRGWTLDNQRRPNGHKPISSLTFTTLRYIVTGPTSGRQRSRRIKTEKGNQNDTLALDVHFVRV